MCSIVILGERAYSSIGELRSICPNILWKDDPEEDRFCLCSIDIPATAKANRFAVEQDDIFMTFTYLGNNK